MKLLLGASQFIKIKSDLDRSYFKPHNKALERRIFSDMDVIPYEHRGKQINAMTISANSDAVIAYSMFNSETDKWLKKMIALKLLKFGGSENAGMDKEKLTQACKCQIEL